MSRLWVPATRELGASQRRLRIPHFVDLCGWEALRPRLPLQLPNARKPSALARTGVSFILPLAAPGGSPHPRRVAWTG
jgi:hypothetical protein